MGNDRLTVMASHGLRAALALALALAFVPMAPAAWVYGDDSSQDTPAAQGDEATDYAVAVVDGKRYEDLQEAIDEAKNGATVKLLADRCSMVTVVSKKLTLDLNGHMIVDTNLYNYTMVLSSAYVTIVDSTAKSGDVRGCIAKPGGVARNDGSFTPGDGRYTRRVNTVKVDDGSLTLKSGQIMNGGSYQCAVELNNSAITVGDARADDSLAIINAHPATRAAIIGGSKPITVNSGTIIGGGAGVVTSGNVTINGGTVKATGRYYDDPAPALYDGVALESGGVVQIKDGTVESEITTAVKLRTGATMTMRGGALVSPKGVAPIEDSGVRVTLRSGRFSAPPIADEDALFRAASDDVVFRDGWYTFGTRRGPELTVEDLGLAYAGTSIADVQLEAYPAASAFRLATGELPEGVEMTEGGLLSGTPTRAGAFSFSIEALDEQGQPGPAKAYMWDVGEEYGGPEIVADLPALVAYGFNYLGELKGKGIGGVTFSIPQGTAPGLCGSNRLVAGVRHEYSGGTFTVRATDALGNYTDKEFTIKSAPVIIGVQPYTSLQDAVDDADAAEEIEIIGDLTESVTVPKGKKVTIQMGNTAAGNFCAAEGPAITNRGELTIKTYTVQRAEPSITTSTAGAPAILTEPGAVTTLDMAQDTLVTSKVSGTPALVNRGTTVAAGPSLDRYKSIFSSDYKDAPVVKCEGAGSVLKLNGCALFGGSYGLEVGAGASAAMDQWCTVSGQAQGGAGCLVAGTLDINGSLFGMQAMRSKVQRILDPATPTGEDIACVALAGDYDPVSRPNTVRISSGTFAAWGSVSPIVAAPGADVSGVPADAVEVNGGEYKRYPTEGTETLEPAWPASDEMARVVRYGSYPVERDGVYVVDKAAPVIDEVSTIIELEQGVEASVRLEASGTRPMKWSVWSGELPQGVELTADGKITGVPQEPGEFVVLVLAANKAGSTDDTRVVVSVARNRGEVAAEDLTAAKEALAAAKEALASADAANSDAAKAIERAQSSVTAADAAAAAVAAQAAQESSQKAAAAAQAAKDAVEKALLSAQAADDATAIASAQAVAGDTQQVLESARQAVSGAADMATSAHEAQRAAAAQQPTQPVKKSSQTINGKAKVTKKFRGKHGKLAKKQTINLKKVAKLKASTVLSFKKVGKAGGKKIKVAKNGKVTLAKGLKAKTHKVKVKVLAAESVQYEAAQKTVTLVVKIKK